MESCKITLSILICVIERHKKMFNELMEYLFIQKSNDVEILFDDTENIPTGTKRNNLLRMASGVYVVFIDADDMVSIDYVKLILKACAQNTDCIGINGTITTNGKDEKRWFISREYETWHGTEIYYRTPNHISPVRRSIALQAMFPHTTHGEDAEYSKRIYPLIKTEVKIPEPIYIYRYTCDEPKKLSPNERLRLARLKQRR